MARVSQLTLRVHRGRNVASVFFSPPIHYLFVRIGIMRALKRHYVGRVL
jgi:hypothetical protein